MRMRKIDPADLAALADALERFPHVTVEEVVRHMEAMNGAEEIIALTDEEIQEIVRAYIEGEDDA